MSKDPNGKHMGTFNQNSLINSSIFDVEFPDGAEKSYSINTVSQNMFAQIYIYSYSLTIPDSIIDYFNNYQAAPKDYKYKTTKSVNMRLLKKTVGVRTLLKYKYGTEKIFLNQLKE